MKTLTNNEKLNACDFIIKALIAEEPINNTTAGICNHFDAYLESIGKKPGTFGLEFFPELNREIHSRIIRRKSLYGWRPHNFKIRVKFLKKFKTKLHEKNFGIIPN